MSEEMFSNIVDQIVQKDPRYKKPAYGFVREALDYTIKKLARKDNVPKPENQHVSGQSLLEGIRQYALEQFGPMALTVLKHWNVTTSRDFGKIVFNMVDFKILGKTNQDSMEDFIDVYNFDEAFADPFVSNENTPDPDPDPEVNDPSHN